MIHGWNDKSSSFFGLANAVQRAKPGDLVMVLDWREAATNGGGWPAVINSLINLNGDAASWIASVADFTYQKLRDWGINKGSDLNFIGHSLGSLLSSEVASRFVSNGLGKVNTITALDPPSQINLRKIQDPLALLYGYDVNGAVFGVQRPKHFDSVATFSRAFLGSRSIAGNDEFASWAHESILMDFGSSSDIVAEHSRVVATFTKLIDSQPKILNNLFSLDNKVNNDFRKNAFKVVVPGLLNHEGVIKVNAANEPLLLVTKNSKTTDRLNGGDGIDIMEGGIGDDTLDGGSGNDILKGESGNDTYIIDNAGDVVTETSTSTTEIDTVQSSVNYTLVLNVEKLTLTGTTAINGTGNILNNTIIGNSAANILYGGAGNDAFTGGLGADIFQFKSKTEGIDTISDFTAGDKIAISAVGFGGGLAGTTISASQFGLGAAATTASQRVMYNSATGGLFFDAYGSGAGAAFQFATLLNKPTLGATDFLVI